jgi:predicted DNA-binding transcriptional regulator YafY
MGRSTRLFEIIQILRGAKSPIPARAIADALEVTKRTVYRDIVTLQAMRIPVEGAAGVGYVMRSGFDLPPLMFTADEIEAIVVGLSLLGRTGDAGLQAAASHVVRKIVEVLPDATDNGFDGSPLHVSRWNAVPPSEIDHRAIRRAIREEQKLQLRYQDATARSTERTVRPIALVYYVDSIVLAAWCELREDFRHFRLDRMEACLPTPDRFTREGERLRTAWRAT